MVGDKSRWDNLPLEISGRFLWGPLVTEHIHKGRPSEIVFTHTHTRTRRVAKKKD